MAKDKTRAERREMDKMFKQYENHLKKGDFDCERPKVGSKKKSRKARYACDELDGLCI